MTLENVRCEDAGCKKAEIAEANWRRVATRDSFLSIRKTEGMVDCEAR